MTHYADPTVVHPGECRKCLAWVRDNETMDNGLCRECQEEMENDDDE